MKNSKRGTVALVALLAAVLWAVAARAQEQVGSVAALEGTAQVQHAGQAEWAGIAAGDAVLMGDHLRTQANSKLKLLFRDDSVLTLAADSELVVDEQVVPAEGPTSRFSLLVGTVRALVSKRYGEPGATFELETPTAVAGVHGTGFITRHDLAAEETTVVGLSDITNVRSKADPEGLQEVKLGPGEATKVRRGAYPLEPAIMPRDQLQGLEGATRVAGEGPSAGGGGGGGGGGRAGAGVPNAPGGRGRPGVDQPVKQIEREMRHMPDNKRPPPPPPN